MLKFRQKGNYAKLTTFLERIKHGVRISTLDKYGRAGVNALESVTPRDTGLTAESWSYEIEEMKHGVVKLSFHNSNIQNGTNIAIVLQYGHATATGGWVEGRDYINPALQPIFDELADAAWKEVSNG